MALTADQNAALQLILEREQSYGDLAALLGVDEDEVRARARAALTELGGADPDRNVGLTDYLLGQADPIGRADAVRHLRDDINDHRLARELIETLQRDVPGRRATAAPRRGAGAEAAPQARRLAGRRRGARRRLGAGRTISFSDRQTRMIAAMSAAAVLLIVVVLGIAGRVQRRRRRLVDDSRLDRCFRLDDRDQRRRGAREDPARRPRRR